ncbi:MAG: DUF6115 domain-containing protein [Thermotogota bacterium]
MTLPFIIISILAIFIGLINLIYMIKIAKKTNDIQDEKLLNIDEDTTNIMTKFRKITTDKMRLLDNKIKIADDVLHDLESSIDNAYSQLNAIEDKINNIQKMNINYNVSKNNKKNKENIPEKVEFIEKIDEEENITKNENEEILDQESPETQELFSKKEETKTEKIRRLLNQGKTPDEIAKNMKIGIGEVILVKNLYNK